MSDHIKLNETDYVHLTAVKRLSIVSERERESLADLGEHVDAERFHTRIDYADGNKSYAQESIDEIAGRGAALVDIGEGLYVPAAAIGRVRTLTDLDREKFKLNTGRTLRGEYKSQIETRAGMVLSTVESAAIMQRISRPYQPAQKAEPEYDGVQKAPAGEAPNLQQQRDAAMAKAKTQTRAPRSRDRGREQER